MSPRIGYHASHEQFSPLELLELVRAAEAAGFDCAKCSDHFHPWGEAQGQSGAAWPWLGATMQATRLPIGIVSAPGYRYHPAVLAQSIATVAAMFEGRLWVALGSGEAINEAITGLPWPEKAERNARLIECIGITRRLLAGETVTHRGRVQVIEAKLYSRPAGSVPLLGAAVSAETAALLAPHVDGLLTTGGEPEAVAKVLDSFRSAGGAGKPVVLQAALSWANSHAAAMDAALQQWAGVCAAQGEVAWDLRRPRDFDAIGQAMRAEDVARSVFVSADPDAHAERLRELAALGPAEIHLHQVGPEQRGFIEKFGAAVLPQLR